MRYAISSRHAIISPCRSSMLWTKFDGCSSDSCVPVSSQAMPRPSRSTCSCAALEVGAVDVGDLELAARRRA